MAEWLMAAVLKTIVPERVSGVRIPLPPPHRSPSAARLAARGREAVCSSAIAVAEPLARNELSAGKLDSRVVVGGSGLRASLAASSSTHVPALISLIRAPDPELTPNPLTPNP